MAWRDKRKLPQVGDDHFQKQAENAILREQCAADIMWEYVDHQHRVNIMQLWFKGVFFAIVCVAFGAVIWMSLASIWKISQKSNIAIADVGVAVTSMVSLISAVIVLPTKIAEHLFPADGEKDVTDFIVKMHEVDTKTFNDRFSLVGDQKIIEDRDDQDFQNSEKDFYAENDREPKADENTALTDEAHESNEVALEQESQLQNDEDQAIVDFNPNQENEQTVVDGDGNEKQ